MLAQLSRKIKLHIHGAFVVHFKGMKGVQAIRCSVRNENSLEL